MKLALGTAQLGLFYGISNKEGQTAFDEACNILEYAYANRIFYLDTAKAYGNSEEVLGSAIKPNQTNFRIITKIGISNNIKDEIKDSLKSLKKKSVYGLLFHNADDFINNFSPKLKQQILELKEKGLVEKIGISAYNPCQINKILEIFDLDLIQIPLNVLDQRFLQNDYLKSLKNRNIEIHSRSVFLQGLLTMETKDINSYFNPIKPLLNDYFSYILQNNISKTEAALGFVKNIHEIDKIVIGVNNKDQLIQNIKSYNKPINLDFENFVCYNEAYINPALWKLN